MIVDCSAYIGPPGSEDRPFKTQPFRWYMWRSLLSYGEVGSLISFSLLFSISFILRREGFRVVDMYEAKASF